MPRMLPVDTKPIASEDWEMILKTASFRGARGPFVRAVLEYLSQRPQSKISGRELFKWSEGRKAEAGMVNQSLREAGLPFRLRGELVAGIRRDKAWKLVRVVLDQSRKEGSSTRALLRLRLAGDYTLADLVNALLQKPRKLDQALNVSLLDAFDEEELFQPDGAYVLGKIPEKQSIRDCVDLLLVGSRQMGNVLTLPLVVALKELGHIPSTE
jgi:hypothetical protein